MKSIIEQASSIMKAIEKAWDQADKPKEFSIKIFEKEEKNFFGMTTKPAKIGIFFTDKPAAHDKSAVKPRPEIKECRDEVQPTQKQPQSHHPAKPQPSRTEHPRATHPRVDQSHMEQPRTPQKKTIQQPRTQTPLANKNEAPLTESPTEKVRRTSAAWNDTMINTTETWLKKTLSLMGMNTIHFTTEIAGKNLKLTFNTPLIADVTHEKQLFRSFAHLIMSSLRNQYKQEIKDLKVILIRPE
jgi:predicted RNA-binding protein Jag